MAEAVHPECRVVAELADRYIDRLRDGLTIPSIDADPAHHGDVERAAILLRLVAGSIRGGCA